MPYNAGLELDLHRRVATDLGHDGLAVLALDVAEGHLGALMLIELELRKVEVGNLVNGH